MGEAFVKFLFFGILGMLLSGLHKLYWNTLGFICVVSFVLFVVCGQGFFTKTNRRSVWGAYLGAVIVTIPYVYEVFDSAQAAGGFTPGHAISSYFFGACGFICFAATVRGYWDAKVNESEEKIAKRKKEISERNKEQIKSLEQFEEQNKVQHSVQIFE